MLLMEFDKAGAEWVIVAYLAGDAAMIDVVESGKSPHVVTAMRLFELSEEAILAEHKVVDKATDPEEISRLRAPIMHLIEGATFLPRTMSLRQAGKKTNHGCNYKEGYRMFALINEIPETDAKQMVEPYSTTVYPGVGHWWEAVETELRKDRTLTNCFGRKVRLLDQWGNDLIKSAISFVPQSTVSDMVLEAMDKMYWDTSPAFRPVDILHNGYDSTTVQYPTDDWTSMAEFAIKLGLDYMSPEIEYNFRKFRVGTDLKVGLDWGNMVGVELVPDVGRVREGLIQAWDQIQNRASSRELA